jgi:hypothetical protein
MVKVQSRYFLILVIASILSFEVFSNDQKALAEYYRDAFLGEKKASNYVGPLDPRGITLKDGKFHFLDDVFKDNYMNIQIQEEAFGLHQYWFDEVVEKSACPDAVLSENLDYIRYLYRLVTISYLFEGMKLTNKLASGLGSTSLCTLTYKEIFGKCTPQTSDMKKFHERVYGKFVNEIEKVKHQSFSKNEAAEFLAGFHSSNSLSTDPVYSRLHEWCQDNKKNCRALDTAEIKLALKGFCIDDKEMINQVCSEKDNFYGLSMAEKATDAIKSSNAFNLINQSGMGEECLRRYGKVFASKESEYLTLVKQYPLLYSNLIKTNSRYLQGELFLPGALKEFDMKGLSDFLTALRPPKPEPIIKLKPKPKPVSPKPVVVVEAPKAELPTAPVPVVVPEPPKPRVSEFEKGKEAIAKGESAYKVNMDNFRDDFEFTSALVVELSAPIKKFQTRSALLDMKAYDLLGSAETPVGLVFLKYLIDTENHQGLYNIITVLGDKFYVINDLEGKKDGQFIELKNDASTGNRWLITILQAPKK